MTGLPLPSRWLRREVLMPLQALAVCVIGGAACQFLKTPLPWMIGPLLAMAMLKFSGLRLYAPKGGRELGQLVIGAALGLYFTPQVAREVLGTWPVLIAAALLATALGWGCGLLLAPIQTSGEEVAEFLGTVRNSPCVGRGVPGNVRIQLVR